MKTISAYKDMEPTYGELAKALKKLDFENKSTKYVFAYKHKNSDALVLLPLMKEYENVMRERFAALSYNLLGLGVIEHEYDLGKMIEQARSKEKGVTA